MRGNGDRAHDPEKLLAAALDWMPGQRQPPEAPVWAPPNPAEVEGMFVGFQVVELLGFGGMGAVYKGFQLSLQRPVAIKILSPALAADPEFEARFQREAILMARLNHPNVVQIYDFGRSDGGHHYLIMEYVEGTDLHEILRSRSLGWDEIRQIMIQVCAALVHAHQQGCLHRDIKPPNIFLTARGQVKVGDFGLARMVVEDGSPSGALLDLTMSSVVMGTPGYIAPEQLTPGAVISPRSDIFSLGVVFYEMLTGELPRGNVWPPSRKVKGISRRIDTVVLKAMEADPEGRYSSAEALSEALSRMPENSTVPIWNGRTGFAAVVAGVCLLGSGLWWTLNEGNSFVRAVSEPAVTTVQSRDEEGPAFPNHYQDVGQVYIDEWPEDAHYQKVGPFCAWSSVPNDPVMDLSRLDGLEDVVQVHVHTKGWVVLLADGKTVSSDGQADRSGIRTIRIGLDDWFGLINEEGELLGFNGDGALPSREVPSDLGPVKDAYLSPSHRIVLLEEGSICVWGADHDGIEGSGLDEWKVCPSIPSGRTAVAISSDNQATAALLDDGSLLAWHEDHGQLAVPDFFQNHEVSSFCIHGGRLHAILKGGGRAYSWGGKAFGWPRGTGSIGNPYLPYPRAILSLIDTNKGVAFVDDRRRPTVDVLTFSQVPEIKEVLDHVRVPDPNLFSLNLNQLAPHVGRLLWMKTESNAPDDRDPTAITVLASPIPVGILRSTDPRPAGRLRAAGTTLLKNVPVAVTNPDDRTDYIACSVRTFGWQALREDGTIVVTAEQNGAPPAGMAPLSPEGFIGMRCAVTTDGHLVHWGGTATQPLGNPSGIDLMDVSPAYAIAFFRDGRFQTWWQRGPEGSSFHQPDAVEPGSVRKVVAGKNGCAWLTCSGEIWIVGATEAKKVILEGGPWIDLDDVADGYVGLSENGRLASFGTRLPIHIPPDLPPVTAVRGGGRLLAARLVSGSWTAWVADTSVGGLAAVAAEVLARIPEIGDPIDFDLYGERTAARMIWIEPVDAPPPDAPQTIP